MASPFRSLAAWLFAGDARDNRPVALKPGALAPPVVKLPGVGFVWSSTSWIWIVIVKTPYSYAQQLTLFDAPPSFLTPQL